MCKQPQSDRSCEEQERNSERNEGPQWRQISENHQWKLSFWRWRAPLEMHSYIPFVCRNGCGNSTARLADKSCPESGLDLGSQEDEDDRKNHTDEPCLLEMIHLQQQRRQDWNYTCQWGRGATGSLIHCWWKCTMMRLFWKTDSFLWS